MRNARGIALFVVPIAAVAVVVLFLGLATMIIADGRFYVTLTVDSARSAPITAVNYCLSTDEIQAVQIVDEARKVIRDYPDSYDWYRDIVFVRPDTFDGRTCVISAPWTRKTLAALDIEIGYWQHEMVVLLFEFEDGSRLLKRARIPRPDEPRKITITIDGGAE